MPALETTAITLAPRAIVLAALAATLPIFLFVASYLANDLSTFFDPCLTWGESSGVIQLGSGPCATRAAATSETMLGAIVRISVLHGGLLLATFLGIFGVLRSRPRLLAPSYVILFIISAALAPGGQFVFTLPLAGLLLALSRRAPGK